MRDTWGETMRKALLAAAAVLTLLGGTTAAAGPAAAAETIRSNVSGVYASAYFVDSEGFETSVSMNQWRDDKGTLRQFLSFSRFGYSCPESGYESCTSEGAYGDVELMPAQVDMPTSLRGARVDAVVPYQWYRYAGYDDYESGEGATRVAVTFTGTARTATDADHTDETCRPGDSTCQSVRITRTMPAVAEGVVLDSPFSARVDEVRLEAYRGLDNGKVYPNPEYPGYPDEGEGDGSGEDGGSDGGEDVAAPV